MEDIFYKLNQEMCRASGYVNKKTGEVIKLSASAKIIYSYLLHRYSFFVLKEGLSYFETQSTIGKACDTDPKTVQRVVSGFIDAGIITCTMKKVGGSGYLGYHYEHIGTDFEFVFKGENKKKSLESKTKTVQDKPVTDDLDYTDDFLSGIVWE